MKSGFSSKNPALRRRAVLALQIRPPKNAIKLLARALTKDPSAVIRHEAAFVLGALHRRKALSPLIKAALQDPSDLVRHEAIEALGDLGIKTAKVKKLLLKFQKEPNPIIKDTALIAYKTLKL